MKGKFVKKLMILGLSASMMITNAPLISSMSVVKAAETGNIVSWHENTTYSAQDVVKYKGNTYRCVIGHYSLSNWTPDSCAALWVKTGSYSINENPTPDPTLAPTLNPTLPPTMAPTPQKTPDSTPQVTPTMEVIPTATVFIPSPTENATPEISTPSSNPEETPGITYPEWTEGKTYNIGDCVQYKSKTYRCIVTHLAYVGANWSPDIS
nr:hypothetical protein [Lachnospiraceae bacterium]